MILSTVTCQRLSTTPLGRHWLLHFIRTKKQRPNSTKDFHHFSADQLLKLRIHRKEFVYCGFNTTFVALLLLSLSEWLPSLITWFGRFTETVSGLQKISPNNALKFSNSTSGENEKLNKIINMLKKPICDSILFSPAYRHTVSGPLTTSAKNHTFLFHRKYNSLGF